MIMSWSRQSHQRALGRGENSKNRRGQERRWLLVGWPWTFRSLPLIVLRLKALLKARKNTTLNRTPQSPWASMASKMSFIITMIKMKNSMKKACLISVHYSILRKANRWAKRHLSKSNVSRWVCFDWVDTQCGVVRQEYGNDEMCHYELRDKDDLIMQNKELD